MTDDDRPLARQAHHHLVRRDVPTLLDQPYDEGLMRIEARGPTPACIRAVISPSRARAIHLIAVEIPTPIRTAA